MNTLLEKTGNRIFSANNSVKQVNFYCSASAAKAVQMVGSFNNWHPVLMRRRVDGWWFLQLWLPHGHHLYRFLVDGEPTLDSQAAGTARDDHNEPASLIAVS